MIKYLLFITSLLLLAHSSICNMMRWSDSLAEKQSAIGESDIVNQFNLECCNSVTLRDAVQHGDGSSEKRLRDSDHRLHSHTLPVTLNNVKAFESDLTGDQQYYNPQYANVNSLISQWPVMRNYFAPPVNNVYGNSGQLQPFTPFNQLNAPLNVPLNVPLNIPLNAPVNVPAQINPSIMSLLALFSQRRTGDSLQQNNQQEWTMSKDASGADKKWPQVFTFSEERVNLDNFESEKKKSQSKDVLANGLSPRSSYLILHGGNYV